MTIHTLAADIADRIPGMQVDSKTNNATVIESLLKPMFDDLALALASREQTQTELNEAVRALDAIALDYEHMTRADMIKRARGALEAIGAWTRVPAGTPGSVFVPSA